MYTAHTAVYNRRRFEYIYMCVCVLCRFSEPRSRSLLYIKTREKLKCFRAVILTRDVYMAILLLLSYMTDVKQSDTPFAPLRVIFLPRRARRK